MRTKSCPSPSGAIKLFDNKPVLKFQSRYLRDGGRAGPIYESKSRSRKLLRLAYSTRNFLSHGAWDLETAAELLQCRSRSYTGMDEMQVCKARAYGVRGCEKKPSQRFGVLAASHRYDSGSRPIAQVLANDGYCTSFSFW